MFLFVRNTEKSYWWRLDHRVISSLWWRANLSGLSYPPALVSFSALLGTTLYVWRPTMCVILVPRAASFYDVILCLYDVVETNIAYSIREWAHFGFGSFSTGEKVSGRCQFWKQLRTRFGILWSTRLPVAKTMGTDTYRMLGRVLPTILVHMVNTFEKDWFENIGEFRLITFPFTFLVSSVQKSCPAPTIVP